LVLMYITIREPICQELFLKSYLFL